MGVKGEDVAEERLGSIDVVGCGGWQMAAADLWAAHLEIQAWRAACRSRTGSDWVLLRAINRRRVAASWLHLPAVSKATTTRRARPPPTISGYVLSLARRAMRSADPDVVRWWRRGWAWDVSGETKVVSMANCAPFQRGSPFAITSIRRSSVRVLWVFKSLRRTLVHTEAPASRQMRAMARSRATPCARKAPERGHAAR